MCFPLLSSFLVSPLAWIMKGIHLVYLSIQYLLVVRYIWGLFIITILQAQYFPLRRPSSLLMFDERHNKKGVIWWGGGREGECYLCHGCFYSTHYSCVWRLPQRHVSSQGSPPFPGLTFPSFPQGVFGLDWIRQGKVGHWLWSTCCIVSVKVKPAIGVFPPAVSAGPSSLCLLFLLFFSYLFPFVSYVKCFLRLFTPDARPESRALAQSPRLNENIFFLFWKMIDFLIH